VARARASRRAQRGVALLGLLAVAVMVFAYVLTSRLNAASQFVGVDRDHNARVLARAKQALIGYMAQQAALSGENNPGHLPCPEAGANYGTANEGIEATFCSAQAIGRLPWRTLGMEKLVDAAGEPLWYAVSPGWHRPNSTDTLTINSDSTGQLALAGVAANAVALVIAPGATLVTEACGGASATTQARPATGAPDYRNYLECGNANSPADASFVASAPGSRFNDQVLAVLPADLMPALEAAIAERMQREIAPALRTVYTNASYSGIPSSSPMYPYAAPFTDPGTSDYQGSAGTFKGLLPFNQTQGCDPSTDSRCTTTLLAWSSGTPPSAPKVGGVGFIMNQSCSWQTSGTVAVCEGEYEEDNGNPSGPGILIEMTATITNVARGLRSLDWSKGTVKARNGSSDPWTTVALESTLATMNSDGSVTVRIRGRLPNVDAMSWGHKALYHVSLERAVIGDHALLDTANATTGWFVRNGWYRTIYYATVRRNTAIALSSMPCTNTSSSSDGCLRFNDSSIYNIRALLVLAGRSLSNPAARPNSTLADYVEYQNCDLSGGVCDPQTLYEQRPVRSTNPAIPSLNSPFNDRVVLVDWNGSLNANQVVSASPLRIVTLP
jgi:hypothetical protein